MINKGIMGAEMDVHEIRAALYKSIGWTYQSPGQEPAITPSLKKWRMVDCRSGRFEYNGSLSGLGGNGQAFRIADVTDVELPNRRPGFRGAIISFKQSTAFKGRTIVATDKGVYNPTTIDLMSRIPFESDDFEKIFEVYSDHVDEARELFTSGLLKKMTTFSQETLGQKLQACLWGEEVHFALEIQESFSFSKTPDSTGSKFVRDLVIEAGSICVILERLYCIQASLGQADTKQDKQSRLDYYKKCLSKMMETAKNLDRDRRVQGQAA